MYGILLKVVPMHYLLSLFNCGNSAYTGVRYIIRRILSFLLSILMSLLGWDQEYVFLDNSPYPIPYSSFVIGGYYKFVWRYNARTHTFRALNHEQTEQNLPALSLEVDQFYVDAFGDEIKTQYNLSDWLSNVKFYSSKGHYPHPVQLISAWSLTSGIWFSYMSIAGNRIKTLIRMMNCNDGSDYEYEMSASVCDFKWRRFEHPGAESGTTSGAEDSVQDSDGGVIVSEVVEPVEVSTTGVQVKEVMTELGSETITELQITREDLEKMD
jgi:hypothetical protein